MRSLSQATLFFSASAFAALGAGCGHTALEAQVRDLRVRLEAAEQSRAELSRKVEELDNRVFLLTDQVESHKVALGRRGGEPRLPVVTIKPPPEPDDGTGGMGDPAILRSIDDPLSSAAPPVAAPPPPEGPRPKITLSGGDAPWLGEGGSAPGAPATASSGDRGASSSTAVQRKARRPPPPPTRPSASSSAGDPGAASAIPAPASTAPAASGEEATTLYRDAYGQLKAGQPEQAAESLRAFVRRFPQHDLADNAQYWLGESFYARGSFREAILEFRTVVRRWPAGNKVPDALLKLGFSHLALGETTDGRAALVEVTDHYPRTEAAQLAAKRLAELPPTENKK